ncbi:MULTISPECIES: carbohydrate ABC transporter permease [Paenibacillus]|uniref:Sugar ABC transporter permease n=2 Tax=Paenibacillus TaxID=44249 RepID=A0A1V4HLY5_9BACL|nr:MULTISPECIES: sugar ABC transporter permease [Paenibacillus]MEC0232393.1 sugar ABC transporter permease [Paenibacillus alba]NQX65381.1 sugar ABC transporter permease [Paenibacillus alba]OPH58586.1 sugar ABC transporter permease [Paenibacillus ferrarius]
MVGQNKLSKLVVIIGFLLPSLAGLLLFQLVPMLSSAVISFTNWDLLTPAKFVGFDNYTEALQDEKTLTSLLNIIQYIIGYLPSVLIFGVLFAVLLNRKLRGIKLYRMFIFVPVITSWVAVSIVWRWLLNGQNGLINYLLSLVGIQGPVWLQDFVWAMPSIIAVSVWKDIGYVTVILLAGLQDISEDYYEAATIDGAGGFQQFIRVTLPLLTPSIFFVLVISLINGFQLFDQVLVMTGGGPAGQTSTLVQQIYGNAFQSYKMGFASAQSWILFVIIFIVTIFQQKLQKRWVTYDR